MKSFICVLFLSVLAGLCALNIGNNIDDGHKIKVLSLFNKSSHKALHINNSQSEHGKLIRVRRSIKNLKKGGCERDLALKSTGIGGAGGAGVGALAGAAIGSVVPVLGTAIGALVGKIIWRNYY